MQLKLQVHTTLVVSGRTQECGVPLIAGEQQFRTRSSPRSRVEPTLSVHSVLPVLSAVKNAAL